MLKGHAVYVEGQNSLIADYAKQNQDMIYDPDKDEFSNVESVGGQIALEHYWRPGVEYEHRCVGFVDVDEQDFEPDDAFDKAKKGLVNLIWRPRWQV